MAPGAQRQHGPFRDSGDVTKYSLNRSSGMSVAKAAAADVGPVIARLRSSGRGTAAELVKAASDPSSPAHRHFEWDNGAAADNFRMLQARDLIQNIVITVEKAPVQKPRTITRRQLEPPRVEVEEVSHRVSLEQRAMEDLFTWEENYGARYRYAPAFVKVFDAIEQSRAAINRKLKHNGTR